MSEERAHAREIVEPPGLFPALADKARSLPTAILVALSLCCWIAIAMWTIPDGMRPALPAPVLMLGAFGLWGVLERVRDNYSAMAPSARVAVTVAQRVTALVGAVSFLLVVFAVLGVMLGVFIL